MKIDAFAHVLPDRYRAKVLDVLRARGDSSAEDYQAMFTRDPTLTDLDARFRLMDELGSDYRQVLVMAHTSAEHEGPDVAAELARIANDELGELVAAHPDRFAGWVAQVSLQDGERGRAAVRHAITERGALGAQIFTSIQGRALDHPDYERFFELMAELERPIWIHPNRTPKWSDYPLTEPESKFMLYAAAGWPSDTTVAMMRIIYAGYLERWPDLEIIVHHSGGTVPMLAGRLKRRWRGPHEAPRDDDPPRSNLEYLTRFHTDTATFGNPIALRASLEFFGTEHVLFGTDFGFSPDYAPQSIDDVEAVVSDAGDRRAIYEGNARRLLALDDAAPSIAGERPSHAG